MRTLVALLSTLAPLALLAPGAAEAGEHRPVASVTIYPGDTIRDDMLVDKDFPDAVASASFVTNRSMIVGKMARRTLLPGQAIPVNAIGEPRLVHIGSMVRVVFSEDGLTIQTYASALQNGAAGDAIALRNNESGVTISGVVQADGSVHVGGG